MSMYNPNGGKLSLKVVMNKQKTKVVFAEASNNFVDVLLSFLALPLGKVVANLGEEAAAVGSLNSLYTGLLNLDDIYFCHERGAKQMLLNPPSLFGAQCRKLALDITDSPYRYFLCQDQECLCKKQDNISMYSDIATCDCGKLLNREIHGWESEGCEGFTVQPMSFIITDDLCVSPIVTGIIQTLRNLGYTYPQGVEVKTLIFGIDEIRDLLKFALTSATPLTDMIIRKTFMTSAALAAKPEPGVLFNHIPKERPHSRKMVLNVFLQKSTSKFLFAEATDEFVELLFSFLIVPLGGVEFLLDGNAGLRNIENLCRSVSNCTGGESFRSLKTRNILMNPILPHGYVFRNKFLPLSEEDPPNLCHEQKFNRLRKLCIDYFHVMGRGKSVSFKTICGEIYLQKPMNYVVTDDLTVCPGVATSLSILSCLGIPLSDVKETKLHIGLEEALRILKASLTSKTALTDALINPMLNNLRRPKQEP